MVSALVVTMGIACISSATSRKADSLAGDSLRPAAHEVAAVGPQAFGDALRRGGPALELQQEGTPTAFVL